jgi:hypothetical protein
MKKQNTSSTKAQLVRGGFYALLLIFFFVIRFALAQQHIVKPTGVLGAHQVPAPRSLSPQEVIYGRYNNVTEIPNSPGPTPTSTPTATATATHTPAPCGQYWTTSGTLPIVPGTTDIGNHCDNCDTTVTLPFSFRLYGVTYNSVMASSNGRLDFLCNNEPAGAFGVCLPAGSRNCPFDYTIFPLWTELVTDSTHGTGCETWANGCGIFTSISGTVPNRIFNIEWHALLNFTSSTPQDFEVRLYENDPNQRFDVIYGTVGNVFGLNYLWVGGVQGPPGFFTEDFCETGVSPPRANTSRTYTFVPCVSPTPTSTPTATATATPTPNSATCSVTGISPPCGSTVNTRLIDFAVYVSDPVDPATLNASDLTCNGIPASAFAYTPGTTTISFEFGQQALVQGPNTMHVPAGAFNCVNGQPVTEFSCVLTGYSPRKISPRPRPTPAPRPTP